MDNTNNLYTEQQRNNYGDGIYKNKMYGKEVVAVKRGVNREITAFKLSDGTVLSYDMAIEAYKDNKVGGMVLQNTRGGRVAFRSLPDASAGNNLQSLPDFE